MDKAVFSQETILVVEDRAINRAFLETLLGIAGYRVISAANGVEALEAARRERPALIISDVLMPVMDGIELASRLRADPALARIPVIFYTATYRLSEARQLAQGCGVNTVLAKPADPQQILDAIAQELGREAGRATPASETASAAVPELAQLQYRLQEAFQHDDVHAVAPLARRKADTVQGISLRLAASLELSMVLPAERDLQQLLTLFCRAAQDIMNARVTAVGLLGEEGRRLHAGRGIAEQDLLALFDMLDPSAGPLQRLFDAGQPFTHADTIGFAATRSLAAVHPLSRDFLVAPIMIGKVARGWICFADKFGNDFFNAEDRQFAAMLAAQFALSSENLILYDEVRLHAGRLELEAIERQQITDRLREREAGLQRAQQMTRLAHVITGPQGLFLGWSETLPELIGTNDVPLSTRDWMLRIHPADRERYRSQCLEAERTDSRCEVEYRLLRPGRSEVTLRQVMEPLDGAIGTGSTGGTVRWITTIQDVSEQREQQRRIAKLNRIYAVLSGINSAIVRIHDRKALLQEACRVAVDCGAFSLAWAGLIKPGERDGEVVAHAGLQREYVQGIRLTVLPDLPDSKRPASIALREKRIFICNDIAVSPELGRFKHELLSFGHRSVAALPLMIDDEVGGSITLFASEAGFFDDEEVRLLTELAGDLSFGLRFIEKEEKLSYLAYYDALTGLPNSMLFHDRLMQLLQAAKHDGEMAAAIVIDLAGFSRLNDALGRHVGDTLLVQIAQRLPKALQNPCSIARLGGDSFAIAVGGLSQAADAATVLEQQVFSAIEAPITVDERELRITARAGLALFPDDGSDAATLFKNAELAFNRARSSAQRYVFYAPDMNAAIAARVAMESELRVALDKHQFFLEYQPRVDLRSGRIVSAEALIRWHHPERGRLPPAQFIALAEETGLIVPIGTWVIDTVCAQQAAWAAQGIGIVPLAINLSTVQFRKGGLLQTIRDAIARHGINSEHIEFELTESIVADDPVQAAHDLHALKEVGVRLSLDDFGTGYSSLAYLKRFPFDAVKIDRAFITDVTRSTEDAAIATAVIAMGHSLGLRVIAEGVETVGQLGYLRRQHCDEIQGYYFSEPVDAAAFEEMLRTDRHLEAQAAAAENGETLLLVDDEPNNLSALRRLLRREGYRILTASSAQEGLDLLAVNTVQVIVSDQKMPGMSGSEFLGIVKSLYPDTIRIILSGYADVSAITDSVNRGAVFKFLTKPWHDEQLREHIRDAFRRYRPGT